MTTPISELTDKDYMLLKYVKRNPGAHIDTIIKKNKRRIKAASIELTFCQGIIIRQRASFRTRDIS
jgi:hypothetical protein